MAQPLERSVLSGMNSNKNQPKFMMKSDELAVPRCWAVARKRLSLLQFREFSLGFFQNGNIGVRIFPE